MKYKTHNDIDIDINMSSLQGNCKKHVTYDMLVKAFGKPYQSDFDNKSDAMWKIEFEDGTIATIYNYKNGKNYLGDDGILVEEMTGELWHIGGYSYDAVEYVNNVLSKDVKRKYYGTFMQKQAFSKYYVTIMADSIELARGAMFAHFGDKFMTVYDEDNFKGQSEKFELKNLITIEVINHGHGSIEYKEINNYASIDEFVEDLDELRSRTDCYYYTGIVVGEYLRIKGYKKTWIQLLEYKDLKVYNLTHLYVTDWKGWIKNMLIKEIENAKS